MSEKFENGVFTLTTYRMFSVHTNREKFENATIIGSLDLCLRKTRAGQSHDYRTSSFLKSSVLKMFPEHTKKLSWCFPPVGSRTINIVQWLETFRTKHLDFSLSVSILVEIFPCKSRVPFNRTMEGSFNLGEREFLCKHEH